MAFLYVIYPKCNYNVVMNSIDYAKSPFKRIFLRNYIYFGYVNSLIFIF